MVRECTKCGAIKSLEEGFYKTKYGYHGSCKECFKKKSKESKERLGQRHAKNKNLKWNYGISIEDFEAMIEKCNGQCVCGATESRKGYSLCVDHNHHTGKVRGLLCHKCNRALGLVEDPTILRKLADYLESTDSRSD